MLKGTYYNSQANTRIFPTFVNYETIINKYIRKYMNKTINNNIKLVELLNILHYNCNKTSTFCFCNIFIL